MDESGDRIPSREYLKKIYKYIPKPLRFRKYNNLVEALSISKIVRKFTGIIVLELNNTEEGIVSKFSLSGFIFFLLWYSLYYYSTFLAHKRDETIIRLMYNTKLQRYGDDCERLMSLAYILLSMWKIPFSLSNNVTIINIIIDVDKILENLGEKVDYNRDAHSASVISIGQIVVYLFKLFSIWLTLKNLNVVTPSNRMYQDVFFNAQTLIIAAYYCYFLSVMRSRFRYVNKVLQDISTRNSWEYKLFKRGKDFLNIQKAESLQDRYISEKIRSCSRIYALLYKAVIAINDLFGFLLVMTTLVCLIDIILYLFYFMEATAAGLFHDLPLYIDFSIYVFWQTASALGILYLIVYFCESIMCEAKRTSFVVHEIMNNNISPSVTAEAAQLSQQILHQKPIFTARGLYQLNYPLLEEGARAVTTYLIILLQFAFDSKNEKKKNE